MASRQSTRLASKQRVPVTSDCEPQVPPSKKKTTNAERCREYKDKLKDNDKYEQYLESQKDRSQQYRSNLSAEQKARQTELSKLRMREMRKRKNEEQGLTTRHTQEQMKAKWRAEYEQRKTKMTPQKKTAINAKRRRQYAAKKAESAQVQAKRPSHPKTDAEPSTSSEPQKDHTLEEDLEELEEDLEEQPQQLSTPKRPVFQIKSTPAARRKTLQRARRGHLPKSPSKYVLAVFDLTDKASPRKKIMFEAAIEKKLTGGPGTESMAKYMDDAACGRRVKNFLSSIKKKKSKSAIAARKAVIAACSGHKTVRASSAALGVHRKTVQKHKFFNVSSSAVKNFKKEKKLEAEVSNFLEVSATTLPLKKLVSSKTGKAAMLLSKPMGDLHQEFREATGLNISKSHFAKCRPAHIRPSRNNTLRQCLCEYCENVGLKVKAVNSLAAQINNSCRIRHQYHAIDLVTCGRDDGKWHMDCAYGKCGACGPAGLDQHLHPLQHHNGRLTWSRWENVAMDIGGKRVVRKTLVRKEGAVADLTRELREEVTFLASHLHRADWQYCQFDTLRKKKPFPEKTVCMVLDFAENFNCTFQDEVQAAHWHYEQCTVHPIVCYYKCPHCPDTVTESLVFISDDRTHDCNAVHAFVTQAVEHLRCVRHVPVDHIIQWTDGCATQYKSKGPFADISCALQDFQCTMERNFFGSRHGKGPSDGESAVVKSGAARAVRSCVTIIQNAEDLFTFCSNSHLSKQPDQTAACKHSLRTFFYVTNISRNRGRTVRTLKGTRALHAVKCLETNVLLTRSLSCTCDPCCSGIEDCENREKVEPWQRKVLKPEIARNDIAPTDGAPEEEVAGPEDQVQLEDRIEELVVATNGVAAELVPTDEAVPSEENEGSPATEDNPEGQATDVVGDSQLKVSKDDFVRVKFTGRQRQVFYFGKVMGIEGGDARVNFFKENEGKYNWADESWVSIDQIVAKINPPKLAPGRGLAFIFE